MKKRLLAMFSLGVILGGVLFGSGLVQASVPFGLLLGNDAAPTMGTCGTATLTAGSSDAAGNIVITAGTPGSCAVVFGQTYGVAPICHVNDQTTANANGGKVAPTTTGFTYTIPTFTGAAANLGSDTLDWICVRFK